MRGKREKGFKYEEIAKNYLINKNLKFIESNFYSRYGEIDLIFLDEKNKILIFVEVKYRKNLSYGLPEEMVNKQKIEKIRIVSQQYIYKNQWKHNIRYDIIGIRRNIVERKIYINWIKNAF